MTGSSPLTRGKPTQGGSGPEQVWLIPAHAGKTGRHGPDRQSPWAHPRSRGENTLDYLMNVVAGGSSPLTRGKPPTTNALTVERRLIPAHAGKTFPDGRRHSHARAHPRSRGENLRLLRACRGVLGSSPLTRGKLIADGQSVFVHGLIPAHAGKTTGWRSRRCGCRAHPRSRGENEALAASDATDKGSSPLTRGKRPATTDRTRL